MPSENISKKENTNSDKSISSKTTFSFTIGELITIAVSALTLISVVVTFLVSYRETIHKVDNLMVTADTTNARINRLTDAINYQSVIFEAILDDDTLYNRVLNRLNRGSRLKRP